MFIDISQIKPMRATFTMEKPNQTSFGGGMEEAGVSALQAFLSFVHVMGGGVVHQAPAGYVGS